MKITILCLALLASCVDGLNLHMQEQIRKLTQKSKSKSEPGTNWAILIAGSRGYYNYRHQADIAHSYHLLKNNGYPEEQIITLMYDDVANSPSNPFPGTLINHPDGDDVYEGIKIDYKGEDCSGDTLFQVMQGNKKALKDKGTGKVLESNEHDRVFIYFADHGGVGLIAMPVGGVVTSHDLNLNLLKMKNKGMFKELVFYMEACESGSMFDGLLEGNEDIFATTAANTHQSSYACYYDADRNTFLGDVYSVNWMENSDAYFEAKRQGKNEEETLQQQFQIVKKETARYSECMEFGTKSISKESLDDYQCFEDEEDYNKDPNYKPRFGPKPDMLAVDSRDVTLFILQQEMNKAKTLIEKLKIHQKFNEEHKNINNARDHLTNVLGAALRYNENPVDFFFNSEVEVLTRDHHKCIDSTVKAFHEFCAPIDEYYLRFSRYFAAICQTSISHTRLAQTIMNECTKDF